MPESKSNDTEETTANQEQTNIPQAPAPDLSTQLGTPPPREYNIEELERFLDTVFQAGVQQDEFILTWATDAGRTPGYPQDEATLLDKLRRTRKAKALYFGTSTCKSDPKDGKLYNRKALFSRLFVVVLDDIGTKVPLEKIPPELVPTYIIESSAGNYQYGYVLKEPIDNLQAADTLIQLVYDSGLSDGGGKMSTKLVRLPEGINGKPGVKQNFISRLAHLNPEKLWEPQELLDALDISEEWEDVLEDADKIIKRRAHKTTGATPWSPIAAEAASLDGIIDPVLEWLYAEGMVVQDTGDWVTIRCPWHVEHTNGDCTAGYSPLGRSDHADRRGFHCFHDHCKDNHTSEFLKWVAEQSGIEAAAFDPAAELCSRWVFDAHNDGAWDIKRRRHPQLISMNALRNLYPESLMVQTVEGSIKKVKAIAAWSVSKTRVEVYGQTFNPADPSRIITVDSRPHINLFTPPEWNANNIRQDDIRKFKSFINYLIPKEEEREFFLDWLAAKIQDMGFRGPAILMVARRQGTGRTTLMDMIATMFERENVMNVPFNKVIGESEFNEWVESPLVISDETLNLGDKNFYGAYERLKELIDPRAKMTLINPKYGKKRRTMCHSSFIFLSNHANALDLPDTDRRFYALENAAKPASPEYFVKLNKWLSEYNEAGEPAWVPAVWYWLFEREVSIDKLLAPPIATSTKTTMIAENASPIRILADAIMHVWPTHGLFTMKQVEVLAMQFSTRVSLDTPSRTNVFKAMIRNASHSYNRTANVVAKLDGKPLRPRVFREHRFEESPFTPDDSGGLAADKRKDLAEALRSVDIDQIKAAIDSYLDLHEV